MFEIACAKLRANKAIGQATSIAQNDNIYWQRDDGAMAVVPVTSGGGGISLKMTGDVFVVSVGGANIITGDITQIPNYVPSAEDNANAVWSKTLP